MSRWKKYHWIAEEPFRLFFISGLLWSLPAVLLWPAFYAGLLGFYPTQVHANLMIQAFGGAFVVGFLGTAGPRVASGSPFSWRETGLLLALHEASALLQLLRYPAAGDSLFALMLLALLGLLGRRVIASREEPPPPQLLLALAGVLSGIVGGLLPWFLRDGDPLWLGTFARLLLHQGFLLLPTLGVGSFLFPRMLGGDFGDAPAHRTRAFLLALATTAAVVFSFYLEAKGAKGASSGGNGLRLGVAGLYLFTQIRWRRPPDAHQDTPRGTLVTGLFWALGLGALAFLLIPTRPPQQIAIAHLLYIGGFGLLMLVVGSRVLFGHSGDLPGFHRVSKGVRWLIFLVVLAATTRAAPAWLPSTTISHHIYAAITWVILALCWLLWHRRRFFQQGEE